MLSTRGRSPRGDEMPPSSAPETSPRHHGPFMAPLYIVAPTRGSGDAAGAAHAHRAAAAHPARRRGEERPYPRRHDGVEAPLHHCARHAAAPPAAALRNAEPEQLGCLNFFLVRARATQIRARCPPSCRPTSLLNGTAARSRRRRTSLSRPWRIPSRPRRVCLCPRRSAASPTGTSRR